MNGLKWLALPAAIVACVTATTASAGASPGHGQRSTAARPTRDADHDGLSDDAETRRYRTDPRRPDTDRDGLRDGPEVSRYRTNPRSGDTDRDGLADGEEV